jgi:hypothetical protein
MRFNLNSKCIYIYVRYIEIENKFVAITLPANIYYIPFSLLIFNISLFIMRGCVLCSIKMSEWNA